MREQVPRPISRKELRARSRRIREIARRFGFVGRVEYRHVYSGTGGAQYGAGSTAAEDLLIVYAEAFRRAADPADYSLEAILAHERGHQVLCRHPRLRRTLAAKASGVTEEIMASLVGSLIVPAAPDQETLVLKALGEAVTNGAEPDAAVRLLAALREYLEKLL